jgi:hypothetical protein
VTGLIHTDCSRLDPRAIDGLGERIGSHRVAMTAASDPRLADKTLRSVFATYSIKAGGHGVNAAAVQAARIYVANPERLERICGLAIYGGIVRQSVDAQAYRKLAKLFSPQDMAIACRVSDAGGIRIENGIDMDRLPELVEYAGRNAILNWYQGIPDALAVELEISSVAPRLAGQPRGGRADIATCSQLVEMAASELSAMEQA